ncbi:MAG: diguanylate cyclase [Nitrospirota bacterium]
MIKNLTDANISVQQIFLHENNDIIDKNYHKAKATIEKCYFYLKTMHKGGFIKDYLQAEDMSYDEFYVPPIIDPKIRTQIEDITARILKLENLLNEMAYSRMKNKRITSSLQKKLSEYITLTQDAVIILNKYIISLGKEEENISQITKKEYKTALILIIGVFVMGASLSIIFGILISLNLVKPINAIVANFRAFTSKRDFAKEIQIISKDELGTLANEYNKFMNTINVMTSFKKIIEEDETVDDIYLRLGKIFTQELGFEKCVIHEISVYKNTIKTVYPPESMASDIYCSMDILLNCDLCRVKRTGHIVSSKEHKDICKYFRKDTGEFHICIPIFISGKTGGVVQFVLDKSLVESPEFQEKIIRAQQYILEAQPVLEAKRIMRAFKESSIKDALTAIYNRRFLEETSEALIAGVQRRNATIGLLMCDLDFFKEVNDKYGHDTGDIVLKETANVIRKSVRTSDIVVRFGGEEFLVVLSDILPETSVEIAEKIRSNMEKTKVTITGGCISKTISVGVSEFPKDTQSFWEAIKFADVALYKAKETGRNKVIRFTPDMWTESRY